MGFWKKLFSNDVQEVDYYAEGLELMSVGKYHDALTSFRLALRESPQDPSILQQVAMAYTRIGMTDQAAKTYRQVLEQKPSSAGARYGLAFLLLHDGMRDEAVTHLEQFLAAPPEGPEAQRHVEHARKTLAELRGEATAEPEPPQELSPGGEPR
ncbi:MAG TPA: tetratricopeptide repeat protein [Longimicrobiales bacterium]|nr:tetratricopeptide repeat protein [Longimicrobiales bacterium]